MGAFIVTDTCADLPADFVTSAGLELLSFPYVIDGEERFSHPGENMSQFYAAMRAGGSPTTSTVPVGDYITCFSAHASEGDDVVFLAFSSGLSSSFQSALMAREIVLAEYPDACIRIVDTLRASIAQGALVAEAVRHRDAGASADEIEQWATAARHQTVGYFTTESLDHLLRGGRVSDAAVAAGAMLDVRPMLTFSPDGKLKLGRLARGRRRSIKLLAERAADAPDGSSWLLIGHADCADEAAALEDLVRENRPKARVMQCDIGPVIGSHTGPGMLAVAFVGG